ncbi:hypothetical protein RIF29_16626 [Crotalaria pallida]|uniref:Late embryogenesis abundant protein n=1 Tax=Crotalaria pallida TaxID=3830 RepID=A0AAN9FFN7_CROPI
MAKITNLISKRSYAVVAESLRLKIAAAGMVAGKGKVSVESASSGNNINASASKKEEIFWMRDPKTGNWIPENYFGQVDDAAELREKFLPKKQNI